MSTPQDPAGGYSGTPAQPGYHSAYSRPTQPPYPPHRKASSPIRHVFGALIGLGLTPVALGLMLYGGERTQRQMMVDFERDLVGWAVLIVGAVLLLVVAASGALSPAGPILGGVVWCFIPVALHFVFPRDFAGWVFDSPIPQEVERNFLNWLVLGPLLAVGVLLVGAGLAGAFKRRR